MAERDSAEHFRDPVRRGLEPSLRDNVHLARERAAAHAVEEAPPAETRRVTLGEEAVKRLIAARTPRGNDLDPPRP